MSLDTSSTSEHNYLLQGGIKFMKFVTVCLNVYLLLGRIMQILLCTEKENDKMGFTPT